MKKVLLSVALVAFSMTITVPSFGQDGDKKSTATTTTSNKKKTTCSSNKGGSTCCQKKKTDIKTTETSTTK